MFAGSCRGPLQPQRPNNCPPAAPTRCPGHVLPPCSFVFAGWKWLFSGTAPGCGTLTGGFSVFPTFGIEASEQTWRFDFSQSYIGVGMLTPQVRGWEVDRGQRVGREQQRG